MPTATTRELPARTGSAPRLRTRQDVVPPPVFLLAPPRSFTSIICGVIGQHPDLIGTPELNLFRAATMKHFLELRQLHVGLLRLVAQLYAGEQTIDSIEMARNWMHARIDLTTADVHRELCARAAPKMLVQKSPRYQRRLSYMDAILAAFPDARFIHVVRHPRGTCESYLDMMDPAHQLLACADLGALDRRGAEPVADPQILWHDYHLRILTFQRRVAPDRWLRVVGEDFLADMDPQLKRVCRFLGIADSPEALARMKQPEASPFACFGPLGAAGGNDAKFLADPRLRPYARKVQSLDGPLPWREDGSGFHRRVRLMAAAFGYA